MLDKGKVKMKKDICDWCKKTVKHRDKATELTLNLFKPGKEDRIYRIIACGDSCKKNLMNFLNEIQVPIAYEDFIKALVKITH